MPSHEFEYWKSLDERGGAAPPEDEFPAPPDRLPLGLSRRGFLGAAGFALASTVAGCSRAPVEKLVPYLVQPEQIVPGQTCDYASTCGACPAGCGVLVRARDGRPLKLEGNPNHPLGRGGLCAVGQASVLGAYDQQRLRGPLMAGQPASWDEVDRAIRNHLEEIRKKGGAVRFLTGSLVSPTLRGLIRQFVSSQPNGRHIILDDVSSSAILDAHERTHGVRLLPHYHLERAEVLVGVDADFLGSWIAPVEHARGYRGGRQLDGTQPKLSYHVQFEARMSLTGSKADQRFRLAPGEIGLLLTHLADRVARKAKVPFAVQGLAPAPVAGEFLDHLAAILWQARTRALVLCGSQSLGEQVLCNFINHLLGGYGATLDLAHASQQRQGNDGDVQALLEELYQGKVAALFLHGCNPVHVLPEGKRLAEAIEKVPLVVSCAERLDESAAVARFVCPDHHFLEAWGDAEPVRGTVSLFQPILAPLGQTRSILESVAAWLGKPRSAHEIVRQSWEATIFPRRHRAAASVFAAFWDRALHDGYATVQPEKLTTKPFDRPAVRPILSASRPQEGTFALVLYPKVGMPSASHAYNPWLHELPDPISKVTWDNYACLSPTAATTLGVADGDEVELSLGEGHSPLLLPAFIQPGQQDQTIAVALGYGSELSRRFARVGPQWLEGRSGVGPNGLVGSNAAEMLLWQDRTLRYGRDGVSLRRTGKSRPLASTQDHHSLSVPPRLAPRGGERRPIVRETTLQAGLELKKKDHGEHPDLWPADHTVSGSRWGMAIDLTACTGCSACVVACQVENNIPVVGKDEVLRHREMHWLRIDRYYSGTDEVRVVHQPMMCQHCGNAPCEVVCPVLATAHSSDGLNQQVYNRCVGTRYCANNCPYKVRRFNWFDYSRDDLLANLVLNPDVTVRSRGVMEKCSFCVQRIQEARLEAKRLGRPVADGAIATACQQSCPAGAIVFGDLNDPKSRVSQLVHQGRAFQVLAELNVKPVVTYLAVVRNRPAERDASKGGGHE